MPAYRSALFWFRRDLRDDDNAGLYYALRSAERVYCAFVFDREILDPLPARADRRVEFIHGAVAELARALEGRGGGLIVLNDRASSAIPALAARLGVDAVFCNGDYEPAARARDDAVDRALAAAGRRFHRAKDQAIFEKDEIVSQSGRPYAVYTPYRNAWMKLLDDFYVEPYAVERHTRALAPAPFAAPLPSLQDLGFEATDLASLGIAPGMRAGRKLLEDFAERIDDYDRARDFPAVNGVSHLSVHNRFGTVSIRRLARLARSRTGPGAATWLSELVWRDFFFQVLWHHPRVAREAFRAEYVEIEWPNDETLFAAWREARTGYPLVDAAMRQLHATGYMHNRLRMVTASFLAKDLLVDWRWGERHFAERLIDFDLAANNGGWQWAASTGCDAQPYFRIFNPMAQTERFDPAGEFVRRWIPELGTADYPAPIVDHAAQRAKALALYRRPA